MIEKQCTKCKEVKPVGEFSKDKNRKDSLNIYCRCCLSIMSAKSRNKPGAKERAKKYIEKNKDFAKIYARKYYTKHKEKIKEKSRRFRIENPDKKRQRDRDYRLKYKEELRKRDNIKCAELSDSYIMGLLGRNLSALRRKDITAQMIEAKRLVLQAKRAGLIPKNQ